MRGGILYIAVSLMLFLLAGSINPCYAQRGKTKAKTSQTSSKTGKGSKSKTTVRGKAPAKAKAPARKESAAEAKRREAETQKEIARTKEQIRKNEAQVKKSLNELGRIQSDIIAGEKVVKHTSSEVNSLDAKISRLEEEIILGEAQLAKMRNDYLSALKKIRAKRNSHSDLAFIFASKDFKQAMQRMRFLREISAWRQKRSSEISAKITALDSDRKELASSREQKGILLNQQISAQQTLQTKYAKQDAVVSTLKKNGAALKSHLSKKQAEANALKGRIAALIAEENRKAEEARRKAEAQEKGKSDDIAKPTDKSFADARNRKPRSGSDGGNSAKGTQTATANRGNAAVSKSAGSGFASMRGSLPLPVDGGFRITNRFGKHALPDLPDVMYDNPGIDAETAAGAKAKAVYGGNVSGVYMIPGFSTVVIVNHGSYYTVYGNIASASVKVGDNVKQGQPLGALAADEENPGHSQIHFEVWHNREKLNPEIWLR